MEDLISELRTITNIAKEDKIKALSLFDEKIKQRREEEQQRAFIYVANLIATLKLAAADGNDKFMVAKLAYGTEEGWSDYARTSSGGVAIGYKDLGVFAKTVYEYCLQTLKLPTEVKENHDGGGMDSWVEIWVTWGKGTTR